MKTHKPVWRVPLLLGSGAASGLLSALFHDGLGDVWSWLALAAPLGVALWCMRRKPRAEERGVDVTHSTSPSQNAPSPAPPRRTRSGTTQSR
jgi:hypothetical protein